MYQKYKEVPQAAWHLIKASLEIDGLYETVHVEAFCHCKPSNGGTSISTLHRIDCAIGRRSGGCVYKRIDEGCTKVRCQRFRADRARSTTIQGQGSRQRPPPWSLYSITDHTQMRKQQTIPQPAQAQVQKRPIRVTPARESLVSALKWSWWWLFLGGEMI